MAFVSPDDDNPCATDRRQQYDGIGDEWFDWLGRNAVVCRVQHVGQLVCQNTIAPLLDARVLFPPHNPAKTMRIPSSAE